MKKRLIIFGIGEFAYIIYHYFVNYSDYEIKGFVVDKEFLNDSTFLKLPVVSSDEVIDVFPPDKYNIFIAVGYREMNVVRMEKFKQFRNYGYSIASFISPYSYVNRNSKLGIGVTIFEGVIIQNNVSIGNGSVIWSGSVISHDAIIGDFCYISPGTVVAGNVKIGDLTFIGANATIINNLKIGEKTFIGAGALITRNTKPNEVLIARAAKSISVKPETFLR